MTQKSSEETIKGGWKLVNNLFMEAGKINEEIV